MKNDDRKPDAWMPVVIGAYLGDTTHLSTEQHGAYFLLLLAGWKRGGNLPNDEAQLAQIAKLTPAKWRAHRGVLLAFWAVDGDLLVQKRQAEEYARAVAFNDRQQANGSKGGRPKKNPEETQTKPTGFLRDNPDETPSPSPIPTHPASALAAGSVGRALEAPIPEDDPDWQAWMQHQQAKRGWSAARRMLAMGHLRIIAGDGGDPAEVLRWALSRNLAALDDCWRRMKNDAARDAAADKRPGESLADNSLRHSLDRLAGNEQRTGNNNLIDLMPKRLAGGSP